jgi:hypothetical protein
VGEQLKTIRIVNTALSEFVERRERRDLSELRGKIQFAENYDYKATREDCNA